MRQERLNLFTNCKSELKYFEAAIAGTITVATPTEPFARAIVDGENGFLATAWQWGDKLRAACAVVDNPGRYAAIAKRGFELVQRNYGWNCHAALIAATVLEEGSTAVSKRAATRPLQVTRLEC